MLEPRHVARAFGVDVKTLGRWANDGKIEYTRLPSGHRRYDLAYIRQLVAPVTADPAKV